MNFSIKHDTKAKKFFTVIGGKECSLKYDKINDFLLDYKLLYVPKNLRGQGVGNRILEHAFNYAKRNMIKIKPSCSYVGGFLDSHTQYLELVYDRTSLTPAQ